MKRRWIILLVLFLMVWLYSMFSGPRNAGSTFSASPDGTRAFYALTQALQLDTVRLVSPFSDLNVEGKKPAEHSVLFIIAPKDIGRESDLAEFISRGNTVVFFDSPHNAARVLLTVLEIGIPGATTGIGLPDLQPEAPETGFIASPRSTADDGARAFSISLPRRTGLAVKAETNVLVGDAKDPKVVRIDHGNGEFWYFADATPIFNEHIDKEENARFFLSLGLPNSAFVFDEFHHGHIAPATGQSRAQLGMVKLFLGVCIFWIVAGAYSRGVRFGPAAEPPPPTLTPSTDFAAAIGKLYEGEEASGILRYYPVAWARRAATKLKLPQHLSGVQIVEQLRLRGSIDDKSASEIAAGLNVLSHAESKDTGELTSALNVLEQALASENSLVLTNQS